MSWGRIAALGVLAAVLLIAAIATWGSLGSAVCIYGLIMMGAGLLFKRFLINRDDNPFDQE